MDKIISFFKKYKKPILLSIGLFLVLITTTAILAFSKRDEILNKMVAKALLKAKNEYHLDVKLTHIHFSGIRTLNIDQVSIVPDQRDSLLQIKNLSISIKILPLIFGDIKLYNISLSDGKLAAVFKENQSNLDFILKKEKQTNVDTSKKTDLAQFSYRIIKQILHKIPSEMDIQNFNFVLNDHDSTGFNIKIKQLNVNSGEVEGKMWVDSAKKALTLEGKFNTDDDYMALNLVAEQGDSIKLNYLEQKLKLKFNCKEIDMALTNFKSKNNQTQIYTSFKAKDFKLYHQKIASRYIKMPQASFDANIFIGKNYIELDSSSKISLKKAYFHPFTKIILGKNKIYELRIKMPRQNAQEIINAFPEGTFESFEGMKVTGDIAYQMHVNLDSKTPDKVTFTSSIKPFQFKIEKYGKVNFALINKPFKHDIYEDGKYTRTIIIGPSNPNYTPYTAISPALINSVLTSEDPSFFKNEGFVIESIRKSIAINYKAKKFVRGGSTISMQLVKNAFLNREKTLVRKIEEMAIVWLIHDQKIISKQRMLEIYFNIIELGKNIYGIGESTQYYFGFNPSEISIGHGVFYANIIPSPKKTMRKFMSNGQLKPYLAPYFRFIGNIMAKRGLTPYDNNSYGFYTVLLKPNLRNGLDAPTISTSIDSLESDNLGDLYEQFKLQNPTSLETSPTLRPKSATTDTLHQIQSKKMDSIEKSIPDNLSRRELRKLKKTDKK